MSRPIIKKDLICTQRLCMRPYSEGDADALVELLMHPGVTRTFMVPEYETKEEYNSLAEKLMEFSRKEDTRHLEYGIYSGGRLVGFLNDCGHDDDTIEIGYVIHPDYRGRGFASEAVMAVLPELKEMGFKTVKAGYFITNPASRRVMEKCGMHPTDEEDEEEYRGETLRCKYCEICFE